MRNGLLSQRQGPMNPQEDELETAEREFELSNIETVAEAFASDGGTWNEFVNVVLGDDLNLLEPEEIEACRSHFRKSIPREQHDPDYG